MKGSCPGRLLPGVWMDILHSSVNIFLLYPLGTMTLLRADCLTPIQLSVRYESRVGVINDYLKYLTVVYQFHNKVDCINLIRKKAGW